MLRHRQSRAHKSSRRMASVKEEREWVKNTLFVLDGSVFFFMLFIYIFYVSVLNMKKKMKEKLKNVLAWSSKKKRREWERSNKHQKAWTSMMVTTTFKNIVLCFYYQQSTHSSLTILQKKIAEEKLAQYTSYIGSYWTGIQSP